MMIPESAMASFCRAQRLAPIKLGREAIMRLPMRPREPYYELAAGPRMRSAFATKKDIPLPQWGPRPVGLDCPMSPDFSGRRCASSCMTLNHDMQTILESRKSTLYTSCTDVIVHSLKLMSLPLTHRLT